MYNFIYCVAGDKEFVRHIQSTDKSRQDMEKKIDEFRNKSCADLDSNGDGILTKPGLSHPGLAQLTASLFVSFL
jgi:hypothetical protein